MRYGFIDAKHSDSLALPTRDTGQARKRLMIGLIALTLLWIAL